MLELCRCPNIYGPDCKYDQSRLMKNIFSVLEVAFFSQY